MEFGKNIYDLNDGDLSRYKDFLLDKVLGEQPPVQSGESFRLKILNRVSQIHHEINKRNEHKQRNRRSSPTK